MSCKVNQVAMNCHVLLKCFSPVSVPLQRTLLPYTTMLSPLPSLANSRLNRTIRCQDNGRQLPFPRFCRAFSTFPEKGVMEGSDLSTKKCVPCSSKDIHAMSRESAIELLPQVKHWELISDNDIMKLQRTWIVKSFTKGLKLFQLIADVAEAEGHHPDLHLVGWNNVKIEIWTHSVGGLTENDFILASKIDSLNMEHLLRKKKATPS